MAKIFAFIFFATLLAPFCRGQDVKRPQFFFNNKNYNHLIRNREIPDYVDGKPAGCLVLQEFKILLTGQNDSVIEGKLINVNTRRPVEGGLITVFFSPDESIRTIITDSSGSFAIPTAGRIAGLKVSCPGFREISIDLGRNRVFSGKQTVLYGRSLF